MLHLYFIFSNLSKKNPPTKIVSLFIHLHILYTPTLKSSFFNPSPLSTILVKVSKLYTECIKSTKSRGLLPAGSNSIERLEGVVHIPLIEVS